jgi:hypothetical protein
MRKLLNSPWFVAALVLAALISVGWSYLLKPHDAVQAQPGAEVAAGDLSANGDDGAPPPRQSVAEALRALVIPPGGRDPFAVIARAEAPGQNETGTPAVVEVVEHIRLSASWVQSGAVLLLFDGRVCQPGDTLSHCTIETADIDGAWVRHPSGLTHLSVGQELAVKTIVPAPSAPLSK